MKDFVDGDKFLVGMEELFFVDYVFKVYEFIVDGEVRKFNGIFDGNFLERFGGENIEDFL